MSNPNDFVLKHGDRAPYRNLFKGTEKENEFFDYWKNQVVEEEVVKSYNNLFHPSIYPNYPFDSPYGELTKSGLKQLFNLGIKLRKKYDLLFNKCNNMNNIILYSTYRKRTILSIQSVMCGIFNINIEDNNNNNNNNNMLNKMNYPKINVLIDEESFLNHPISYSDIEESEKEFEKISNENIRYLEDLSLLFPNFVRHLDWDSLDDIFTTLKSHNIYLDGIDDKYINKIFEMSQLHRKLLYNNERMLKNIISEAYKRIYEYMNLIMKDDNKDKNNNNKENIPLFVCYSGHDTTLYSMLIVLNKKFENIKPAYSSDIDIELYENVKNGRYYYKIYYCDELIENDKSDKDGFIPIEYFPYNRNERKYNNSFSNFSCCCLSHKKNDK